MPARQIGPDESGRGRAGTIEAYGSRPNLSLLCTYNYWRKSQAAVTVGACRAELGSRFRLIPVTTGSKAALCLPRTFCIHAQAVICVTLHQASDHGRCRTVSRAGSMAAFLRVRAKGRIVQRNRPHHCGRHALRDLRILPRHARKWAAGVWEVTTTAGVKRTMAALWSARVYSEGNEK
jgi:hypothetical protein